MYRVRVGVTVLAVAVVACGWWVGDNRAQDKAPVRVRGTLPPYYKRLGLSTEQTQQIYKIRSDYRGKIDELRLKIEQLQKAERKELEKVLTPAQRDRLRELRSGETGDRPRTGGGDDKVKPIEKKK